MNEPSPLLHRLIWTALVAIIFGTIVLFAYRSFKHSEDRSFVKLPDYAAVPDFSFTERTGRKITNQDLKGKVWVADFIFTKCPGPCPLMSAKFEELQQMINRAKAVKLVSFSVDPVTDTPAVLTEYANRMGAQGDQWLFLTGDPDAMRNTVVKGFLLPLELNSGADVATSGKYAHSTKFVLVDPAGRIRGYYDGLQPDILPKLLRDVGYLMREFKL